MNKKDEKKILYFDCFSGVSTDRLIGGLLGLGIDPLFFQTEMKKLCAYDVKFDIIKLNKYGVIGYKVKTTTDSKSFSSQLEVEKIILESGFCSRIRSNTIAAAKLLKESLTKKKLAEIIGVFSLIELIMPDFILTSPITAQRQDDEITNILKDACITVKNSSVTSKIVTLTGAATVASCAKCQDVGELNVLAVGYGIGVQEMEVPNLLRIVLGQKKSDTNYDILEVDKNIGVETNIDLSYSMKKVCQNKKL